MKRISCLLLFLCLLLTGCASITEYSNDAVTFYYLCRNYQEDMESVIESEKRDAAGNREDLNYLLALYLIGPSADELVSPLPEGTQIQSARQRGSTVTLRLSDTEKDLTDAEFTLACACLSLTCLDLTDADEVIIHSGPRSITMTRENLTLTDSAIAVTEETQ